MIPPSGRSARNSSLKIPNEVDSYKAGKVTLIGWFVGQVMKKMRGKADPTMARQVLEELLK